MDLERLFKPVRTAIVGVSSENPLHPANVIYSKNLRECETEVFAVNPGAGREKGGGKEKSEGKEIIHRQIRDINEDIDLAVIAVRAELVLDILIECGKLGAGGAIVISGGFAEAGRGELQQKLVEIAGKYELPVIGPNCLGIYSPPYIDTIFLSSRRFIKPGRGNIAFISQSGGFMIDQGMSKLAERDIGVSACVSLGNKAVVDEAHVLEYFESDERTKAMIFHLEGFNPGRGREFVRLAEQSSKPVIVYKAGKSEGAKKAVLSHTGALSGNYRVASSVFKQHGIIEARDEYDISALAKVFSLGLRGITRGDIAILTVSGGHGVVAADLCLEYGLNLVQLGEEEKLLLRTELNPSIKQIASLGNPVDLTGSSCDSDFEAALDFLLAKQEVEAVLLLILPYQESISSKIGLKLARIAKQRDKPVIAYLPRYRRYSRMVKAFEKSRIPAGHTVEEAVKMVRGLTLMNK